MIVKTFMTFDFKSTMTNHHLPKIPEAYEQFPVNKMGQKSVFISKIENN